MGKPYGHEYFFRGNMCSHGTMVCAHCHAPIDTVASDWMSYKKSDKSEGWGYVCFHRRCRTDQEGWTRLEAARAKALSQYQYRLDRLRALAEDLAITDPLIFAQLASSALDGPEIIESDDY